MKFLNAMEYVIKNWNYRQWWCWKTIKILIKLFLLQRCVLKAAAESMVVVGGQELVDVELVGQVRIAQSAFLILGVFTVPVKGRGNADVSKVGRETFAKKNSPSARSILTCAKTMAPVSAWRKRMAITGNSFRFSGFSPKSSNFSLIYPHRKLSLQ